MTAAMIAELLALIGFGGKAVDLPRLAQQTPGPAILGTPALVVWHSGPPASLALLTLPRSPDEPAGERYSAEHEGNFNLPP
jgi:hypothetical protein